MTRVLALLALVLLGAFFLPWFGADLGALFGAGTTGASQSLSGYQLVRFVVEFTLQAADAGAPDAYGHSFREFWPIWLLAAIPVFGLLTLLAGLAGAGLSGAFAFLAGAAPVGLTIYFLVEGGRQIFDVFQVGAWVTLGAGALLVLLAFAPRRG